MKRRLEYVTRGSRGVEQRTPISWFWVLVPLLGILFLVGVMYQGYETAKKQSTQSQELKEEIRVLRASNKKLALLERELLELRELQQQMLRLVGVEQALGVDLKLLQELQAASSDSSGSELLMWPIKGRLLVDYSEEHPSIDLGVPKGTTVVSPGDGVVIKAVGPPFGQSLYIDHQNGTTTIYRNLSMVLVDPEDHLIAGQVIGLVGEGDDHSEPYLRFQVLIDNQPVRPQEFVFQEPPWVVQ